jgi:Family of unknown function (DUF6093)
VALMQRHHVGSGRRDVIPADWSAHHRPVLSTTHTATVQLRRPGGVRGAFDDATGTWALTPFEPYFEGAARVQVMPADEQQQTTGEQQVSTLGYAVMLDSDVTGMQLEDVCTVTAVDDNGDAWLVGRELLVKSIESGSLHWERRLLCSDNLETAS